MNEYMQFSAKTKNEAITKACIELGVTSDQLDIQVISELGVSSDQLDIEVVSEGSSGFFGIGSKPAIIKARKVEDHSEEKELEEIVASVKLDAFKDEPKPEQKKSSPKPAPKAPARTSNKQEVKPEAAREEKPAKPVRVSKPIEIITDPAEIKEIEERASVFLHDVFASMDLGEVQITSKYNTTDGCLEVDFEGQDMGILIGKRGQTLDSLQYLTSLVVNKGKSDYIRVKLDTEDYRRRRKETLENLARGIAYKVKKTRKSVVLEPMNPYERRIIHSALQGNKFVETVSEGEEPYRHVVVKLKRY